MNSQNELSLQIRTLRCSMSHFGHRRLRTVWKSNVINSDTILLSSQKVKVSLQQGACVSFITNVPKLCVNYVTISLLQYLITNGDTRTTNRVM